MSNLDNDASVPDTRTARADGSVTGSPTGHADPPHQWPWSWLGAVAGGLLITVVAGFEIGGCPPFLSQSAATFEAAPVHTAEAVMLFPIRTVAVTIPRAERHVAQRVYQALRPGSSRSAQPHS